MIPNKIRRLTMRNLPDKLALVHIDRGDPPVRRLHQWQPLWTQPCIPARRRRALSRRRATLRLRSVPPDDRNDPIGPFGLLTTVGVNTGPSLYFAVSRIASARSSGVKSIMFSTV